MSRRGGAEGGEPEGLRAAGEGPTADSEGAKADSEGAKADSEGAEAEAEGPRAAGEGPKADSEGAKADSEGAKADPEGAKADPEGAKADPEGAKADSEGPKADPEGAKADSEGAKADPEGPKADSEGAKADSEGPKADPEGAKADPEGAKADFEGPKADPEEPKADSEESKADSEEPKADPEEAEAEGPSADSEGPSAEGPSLGVAAPSVAGLSAEGEGAKADSAEESFADQGQGLPAPQPDAPLHDPPAADPARLAETEPELEPLPASLAETEQDLEPYSAGSPPSGDASEQAWSRVSSFADEWSDPPPRALSPAKAPAPALEMEEAREASWAGWVGLLSFLAALALCGLVRFYALDAKPLHHDEGVNAFFLTRLLDEGVYHYDPTNYHGPFLYFAGYLPLALEGRPGPWSLRFVPALCSVLTLLLLIPLRRWVGWCGVAAGAWLLALSPSLAYVGRTAIHESYFVASVLLIAVALAAYARRARAWLPACMAAGVALAYANKETGVISYAALGCGAALAWFGSRGAGGPLGRARELRDLLARSWGRTDPFYPPVSFAVPFTAFLLATGWLFFLMCGLRVLVWRDRAGNAWEVAKAFALDRFHWLMLLSGWLVILAGLGWLIYTLAAQLRYWWKSQPRSRRPWWVALGVFALITTVLFSSLFTSPRGLFGLTTSLVHWVARGIAAETTGHEKPWPYYFELLTRFELPLLVLGAWGALAALARRRPLGLFLLGWGGSTVAVYTALAYKTPWLIVNLIVPLALLGAYGLASALALLPASGDERARPAGGARAVGGALLALAAPLLALAPNPAPDLAHPAIDTAGLDPEAAKAKRAGVATITRWLGAPRARWCELLYDLNVLAPDDDRYHLVYAQTSRDARLLFRRLNELLDQGGSLAVHCDEYWPLPAYVYPRSVAYPSGVPERFSHSVLLLDRERDWELRARLSEWRRERHRLRPGVPLFLYYRPEALSPASED